MATETRERAGEFSLIINEVEKDQLEKASQEFAAAFSLDPSIAEQIVKSAPIVFAQKLTKQEVKAISPKLCELSAKGLEFRVTARATPRIPKVNWPIRPQFTAGGSAGPNGIAFNWENNAFVCPGCGETFLFRRLGPLRLAAPAAEAKPQPVPAAPAPVPAAPKPVPQPVAKVAQRAPAAPAAGLGFGDEATTEEALAPPAGNLEGVEGADLLGEVEGLDFGGTGDEIELGEVDLAEATDNGELTEVPLEAEPVDDFQTGAVQPPDETAVSDLEVPLDAPLEEAAPATPSGELYNVFLSKIASPDKREKAAGLIAEVKRCAPQEAKELATRLVIPLAKGVSKGQAEDILNRFKKLKVFGRMTKVKS